MKDTIVAVFLSLVFIALFTVVVHFFFPSPYEPAVKIHIIEDVEQNAQDQLDEIREMQEEQQELRKELMKLKELLDQYERGTLKSA